MSDKPVADRFQVKRDRRLAVVGARIERGTSRECLTQGTIERVGTVRRSREVRSGARSFPSFAPPRSEASGMDDFATAS